MAWQLKLATAGTGYFAQFHYEAWSRIENVDLVGLCALDGTMGRNIADRFDVDTVYGDVADMLDACKPDLLDIATPRKTARNRSRKASPMPRQSPPWRRKPVCR